MFTWKELIEKDKLRETVFEYKGPCFIENTGKHGRKEYDCTPNDNGSTDHSQCVLTYAAECDSVNTVKHILDNGSCDKWDLCIALVNIGENKNIELMKHVLDFCDFSFEDLEKWHYMLAECISNCHNLELFKEFIEKYNIDICTLVFGWDILLGFSPEGIELNNYIFSLADKYLKDDYIGSQGDTDLDLYNICRERFLEMIREILDKDPKLMEWASTKYTESELKQEQDQEPESIITKSENSINKTYSFKYYGKSGVPLDTELPHMDHKTANLLLQEYKNYKNIIQMLVSNYDYTKNNLIFMISNLGVGSILKIKVGKKYIYYTYAGLISRQLYGSFDATQFNSDADAIKKCKDTIWNDKTGAEVDSEELLLNGEYFENNPLANIEINGDINIDKKDVKIIYESNKETCVAFSFKGHELFNLVEGEAIFWHDWMDQGLGTIKDFIKSILGDDITYKDGLREFVHSGRIHYDSPNWPVEFQAGEAIFVDRDSYNKIMDSQVYY